MAATRVISVVGKKDAGKTSLVVALAAEFVKRGRRVATIKHGTHPADVDKPGTDTYRQYHEGMAGQGVMGVPGSRRAHEERRTHPRVRRCRPEEADHVRRGSTTPVGDASPMGPARGDRVPRVARRLPGAKTDPKKRGIDYPVSFRVDTDAPLGFTLLDGSGEHLEHVLEEPVGA